MLEQLYRLAYVSISFLGEGMTTFDENKMFFEDNVVPLETLDSMIEFNTKWATDIYKAHKMLYTMIVGYTADGKQKICFPGLFRDHKEKNDFLDIVKIGFSAYNVDKYAVISETWGVRDATSEVYKKYNNLADHPDRIDCLMIIAVNKIGNTMRMFKILEDKTLDFWYDNMKVGGNFTELLPTKKPTESERKILMSLLEHYRKIVPY